MADLMDFPGKQRQATAKVTSFEEQMLATLQAIAVLSEKTGQAVATNAAFVSHLSNEISGLRQTVNVLITAVKGLAPLVSMDDQAVSDVDLDPHPNAG